MWVIRAATLKSYKNPSKSVSNNKLIDFEGIFSHKKNNNASVIFYIVHVRLRISLSDVRSICFRYHWQVVFFFSNQRAFQHFKFIYNFSDRFCSKFPTDNILIFSKISFSITKLLCSKLLFG